MKSLILLLFFTFFPVLELNAENSICQEKIKHKIPPEILKALYVNLNTAMNPQKMKDIIEIAEKTEINSLIIDIKSEGKYIIFNDNEKTKQFLDYLHSKNIYLIARIVVFKGGPKGWYDPASKKDGGKLQKFPEKRLI